MKRCSPWLHRLTDRITTCRKRSIVAERLLRYRPTFSKSLMVSVSVSKLSCTELFFVEPGIKVDGRYYRQLLLKQQMLLVMRGTSGQHTRSSSSRHGSAAAARHITVYHTRPVATKQPGLERSWLQYMGVMQEWVYKTPAITQLTSSSASLRCAQTFCRRSLTKPLPSDWQCGLWCSVYAMLRFFGSFKQFQNLTGCLLDAVTCYIRSPITMLM